MLDRGLSTDGQAHVVTTMPGPVPTSPDLLARWLREQMDNEFRRTFGAPPGKAYGPPTVWR